MTTPGGRGLPPLEHVAQDVLAAARQQPRQRFVPPLTESEKAEAGKVEQARAYCTLCGAVHALPSTAACPRLASFELDGDGKVRAGTFFAGKGWAKGRAVFIEDLKEAADAPG